MLFKTKLKTLIAIGILGLGSTAWAADPSCNVPDFEVQVNSFGSVSTLKQALNCPFRQLSLAYFGKIEREMAGLANEARSGPWTSDGARMAREAADIAVKNSVVKNGIDTFMAYLKVEDEFRNAEDIKKVVAPTLAFMSRATQSTRVFLCENGRSCSTSSENFYSLTAETLKAGSQAAACLAKDVAKCADYIKTNADISDKVAKLTGASPYSPKVSQWAGAMAEWITIAVDGYEAGSLRSAAKGLSVGGDLINAGVKTYTGSYWRPDTELPTGFNNLLETIGEGASTWMSCAGAAVSINSVKPGEVTGAVAGCMSKLNDYFNTQIARIMGYLMAFDQASKEQYKASTIDGARVVIAEVLLAGGWSNLFKTYGISNGVAEMSAPTKDIRVSQTIEAIAGKRGVSHSGIAALHSNWWDGWSGDVLRVINQGPWPQVQQEARLIATGQKHISDYAGIKLIGIAVGIKVALDKPSPEVWGKTGSVVASAVTTGAFRGVELIGSDSGGAKVFSTKMVPVQDRADGSSQWSVDLFTSDAAKALRDGQYSLKAVLTAADGKTYESATQRLVVKAAAAPAPTTLALTAPSVVTAGVAAQYSLRAVNTSATPSPALVVKNSAGTDVMISTFQTRTTSNGVDVWSYSGALQLNMPGRYSAVARANGVDGKTAESAAVAFTLQPAPAPTGSVDNAARLSGRVGETLQMFGKISNADVVYLDFYTAAATTQLRERAKVDKAAGTWAFSRAFSVAGAFTYQVRAEDATTKALTDLGSRYAIDITDVATPPPTPVPVPTLSAAQTLAPLHLNQAASFGLTGSNLSASTPPRVSLAGCDGPALTVVSPTSARFTCTPRVVGPARLFWKLPGNDTREFELGPFTVQPASADGMDYLSNTPEDNLLYEGGAKFTKTWQLKNSGTTTWTNAWCLRPQDGPALGTAPVCVTGTVRPGSAYNFSVPMTLPAAQASTVSLRQYWRLENAARVQVGIPVFAAVKLNARLHLLEPFAMPDSVRANTEWWVGSLKLSGAASQVRMQLTGPQGPLTPFPWTAATADQWSLQYRFATPGDYSWTLTVQGATGTDSRSGTVKVLAAHVVTPVVTPSASPRVEVGKPWTLVVDTSVIGAAVTVQFAGESALRMATTDNRRYTLMRSFAAAGAQTYTLRAMFPNLAAQTLHGTVQVDAATVPTPPPPPPPPSALNPLLTRSASVQALQPWSATLRTDAPVYQADLVFKTGRRIPFDGGPTQWTTRDENSRFTDAGSFDYELHLRRTAASSLEVFPGGTLEVRPVPLPANPPRITSAASVAQGQPYNLTVQTATPADKVMVRWPDQASEQGLRPLDAGRTQWEFGARLFPTAGAQAFTVRSYKEGFAQPTGELQASLQVTVPNAAMRLLEISRNIIKGEKPYFTVEASLAVTQVTVKLGALAAVPLVGSGASGAVQNFRARVPVAEAGAVPYLITGYNAQGQAVGVPITGMVQVADVGDTLSVPNPVPAELQRGQAVTWMFRTAQAPSEMWAEFSAPIGTLPLTGYYLNHTFNVPAGNYSYRVMRRDHLGNVFAIQGAAGSLRIKDAVQVAVPTAQVQVNPNPGQVGQAVQFAVQLSSGQDVAQLEWVFPSTGPQQVVQAVLMQKTSAATWTLAQAFASPGSRPSQLKVTMSDGRSAVLGSTVVTTAAAAPAYLARVDPASVRVGQPMSFAVQVADPASVARAELVFTDVNLTEALVQTAANTWARTRPMAQAGANRPYLVRLLLKSGATAQVNGTYTVTP